jgi:hypothetical protein
MLEGALLCTPAMLQSLVGQLRTSAAAAAVLLSLLLLLLLLQLACEAGRSQCTWTGH